MPLPQVSLAGPGGLVELDLAVERDEHHVAAVESARPGEDGDRGGRLLGRERLDVDVSLDVGEGPLVPLVGEVLAVVHAVAVEVDRGQVHHGHEGQAGVRAVAQQERGLLGREDQQRLELLGAQGLAQALVRRDDHEGGGALLHAHPRVSGVGVGLVQARGGDGGVDSAADLGVFAEERAVVPGVPAPAHVGVAHVQAEGEVHGVDERLIRGDLAGGHVVDALAAAGDQGERGVVAAAGVAVVVGVHAVDGFVAVVVVDGRVLGVAVAAVLHVDRALGVEDVVGGRIGVAGPEGVQRIAVLVAVGVRVPVGEVLLRGRVVDLAIAVVIHPVAVIVGRAGVDLRVGVVAVRVVADVARLLAPVEAVVRVAVFVAVAVHVPGRRPLVQEVGVLVVGQAVAVVVDAIADLAGVRVDGVVGVVAVAVDIGGVRGLIAGQDLGVAEAVAVGVGVPGVLQVIRDLVFIVDQAVAVVVDAIADLFGVGADRGVHVVAVAVVLAVAVVIAVGVQVLAGAEVPGFPGGVVAVLGDAAGERDQNREGQGSADAHDGAFSPHVMYEKANCQQAMWPSATLSVLRFYT